MVEAVAQLLTGGVLVAAGVAKLVSPQASRASLSGFGITGERAQWAAWAGLVALECGLAVAVIAGSDEAAILAAALMAMFAATIVGAILRGRAGAPCACFGVRSTVGWRAVARNVALAIAFAAIPFLPEEDLSTDQWLGLGLAVALIACGALALAVLALAREVGVLRLRLGPEGALEIAEEGPPLGSRAAVVERFAIDGRTEFALAVFTSAGCHVCKALEPSIAAFARDPLVSVALFEENADADVWEELGIPGSPFAIAMSPDGTVLAKGAFNNLGQLESVLAAAERRRAERLGVEALLA